MNLPFSYSLPIQKLASSFSKTSATYKFYWLIGIIELVEKGHTTINKIDLNNYEMNSDHLYHN